MSARVRLAVVVAALVLSLVVTLSSLLDVAWPGRAVATVAFFAFVPGLPIALRLGDRSIAQFATVTVAASLAGAVLLVQAMLMAGAWSPVTAQLLLAGVAGALLAGPLLRGRALR
jgi:hypothetical protein